MARKVEDSKLRVPRHFHRPWLRSERPVPRTVVAPLERFLREEAGSGMLLLAAALTALVWINIDGDSYENLWTTGISVELGSLALGDDLRHFVNDLLMAIFFYVVALEVKRELLFGSLRERRSAAVPIAAAFGTIIGAALVYVAVNASGGDLDGWAVPIATDIAFVLAALGIAGNRIPSELRAFMLTLAVVDDLAAIAVIALFFSGGISFAWLAGAMGVGMTIILIQRLHIRVLAPYVFLAALLWIAVFESGVHATIAGVAMGFMTPARPFYPRATTAEVIGDQLTEISESDAEVGQETMRETSRLALEAISPLSRMETAFHPWSAYIVLPLFALANAGVVVSADAIGEMLTGQIGLGILIGLVIGKPLGGIIMSRVLVRFGGFSLPEGLGWSPLIRSAPLIGIGFTVAIFLAVLAFDDPAKVEQAKLAILFASVSAGTIGLAAIWARR